MVNLLRTKQVIYRVFEKGMNVRTENHFKQGDSSVKYADNIIDVKRFSLHTKSHALTAIR